MRKKQRRRLRKDFDSVRKRMRELWEEEMKKYHPIEKKPLTDEQ